MAGSGLRGFQRQFSKGGGWFSRLAVGDGDTTPYYPLFHIFPTSAPAATGRAGDVYVDTSGVLNVHNGTNWVAGGSANMTVRADIPNAASAVDQNVFIADRAYQLVSVRGVYAANNGAAFTMDVKKCTGTQAPSAGVTMLSATQDWNATANTVITSTLSATPANTALATGDRIALDFTGTATSIAGAVVAIVLRPI